MSFVFAGSAPAAICSTSLAAVLELAAGGHGAARRRAEAQLGRSRGEEVARAVACRGQRVFAVGIDEDAGDRDFLVRALDARTGDLLWDETVDPSR